MALLAGASSIICFGAFELDAVSGELRTSGADLGSCVPIREFVQR
jgi:hypothetical protein